MLEEPPLVSGTRPTTAKTRTPGIWVSVLYVLAAGLDVAAFLKIANADPLATVGQTQSIYEPLLLVISTGLLFLKLGGRVPWGRMVAGPLIGVAVYGAYAFLSSLWSLDPVLTIGKSLELMLTLLNAALLVAAVHRDGLQDRFYLYCALAVLLTAVAFLVANQVIYGTPLWSTSDKYDTRERLWLAYTHPLAVADMAGLGLLCALLANVRLWTKIALVALLGSLLFLTQSRGATVGVAVGMLTFAIARKQTGAALTWRFAFLAALAVFLGGAVIATLASDAEILSDVPPEVATLNGRLDLWAASVDFALDDPLRTVFGYGYFASRFVLLDSFSWGGHTHQMLLEVLLTTGVVGLSIFGYFLLSALRLSMRDSALLTIMAYVIVVGFDDPILFQPGLPMSVLMWCIAHVLEQRRLSAEQSLPARRKVGTTAWPNWVASGAHPDRP